MSYYWIMEAEQIVVADAHEQHRFEAHHEGALAGFAAYQKAGALIVFTHTEVKPEFEGQGVGSVLIRRALDAVREDGRYSVLPLCPFVRAFISRHPEYADLVFAPPRSTATD